MSLSAHKFHGPKGAGVLYARRGVALTNVIEGGAQERGKRAGTENVPAIVGMAAALHEAMENLDRNAAYVTELRRTLEDKLSRIPESRINGDRALRLPGTLNMCFAGIEGEPAAPAGSGRYRSVLRFRLHQRQPGSQPCASGHRRTGGGGPRLPAAVS